MPTPSVIARFLSTRLGSMDCSSSVMAPTTVVRITEQDERRARATLVQYDDKDFSLTDATSFAVMERLGISEAFSFDHHFRQYGFHLSGIL